MGKKVWQAEALRLAQCGEESAVTAAKMAQAGQGNEDFL